MQIKKHRGNFVKMRGYLAPKFTLGALHPFLRRNLLCFLGSPKGRLPLLAKSPVLVWIRAIPGRVLLLHESIIFQAGITAARFCSTVEHTVLEKAVHDWSGTSLCPVDPCPCQHCNLPGG